jgi:hypothetical protein
VRLSAKRVMLHVVVATAAGLCAAAVSRRVKLRCQAAHCFKRRGGGVCGGVQGRCLEADHGSQGCECKRR